MACGTPVLATSKAVRALEIVPGNHAIVADDPSEQANQILSLLRNKDRQSALALSGRSYVENHHNWKSIAEQLAQIYCEVNPVISPGESKNLAGRHTFVNYDHQ
jgi:glycosyltransferase involved in cell wall biosynthesis